MSSGEIKTIYKKLVQRYGSAYSRNPLSVLNTRIEAYVRHEWKAKEPAILDLALREGVEIPKVKELIEKGRTRREAILEVSKIMKFRVSETEAKKWLKELKKKKPGTEVKKVAEKEFVRRKDAIEKMQPLYRNTQRLDYAQAAIAKKIARYERDLRYVHWLFLGGLGVILLGLFNFWLIIARVTLFVFGRTRFIADPLTFGAWGIIFVFSGLVMLVSCFYVRIRYPSKLQRLRDILQKLGNHKA